MVDCAQGPNANLALYHPVSIPSGRAFCLSNVNRNLCHQNHQPPMASILFTTGATVTFKPLVEYICTPEFLRSLQKLGFSTVYLQYGNETANNTNISKVFFNDVIAKTQLVKELDLDLTNETNDKSTTTFSNGSLLLVVFGFSAHIADYVASADIVVSHAGTGSILDSLRLKKPLLVVSNLDLMDNHQEEVASQFEKEGFLYHITTQQLHQGILLSYLEKFASGNLSFVNLPDPLVDTVKNILAEELARK